MNNSIFLAFDTNKMKQLNKVLTPSESKLFNTIVTFLPRAFPSIARLCADSNLSRNTVFKCLKGMELKGVLKRYNRNGMSNVYIVAESLFKFKKFFHKMRICAENLIDEYNKKFCKNNQYQNSERVPVPNLGTVSNNININRTFFIKNIKNRTNAPTSIGSILSFT